MIETQLELQGVGLTNKQIAKRIERLTPIFRARKQRQMRSTRGGSTNRVGAIREVPRDSGRVFRKVVE